MATAILPLSLNQSTTCTIHHVLITAGKKEWRAQDLHSSYFDEMRDHNEHVDEHRYSPSVRRLRSKRFRSSWATAFSYRATAASWDRIWSRAVCAAAGGSFGSSAIFCQYSKFWRARSNFSATLITDRSAGSLEPMTHSVENHTNVSIHPRPRRRPSHPVVANSDP